MGFFLNEEGRKLVKAITLMVCLNLKKEIQLDKYQKGELYIILARFKHVIQTAEEYIKSLNLRDINPQES